MNAEKHIIAQLFPEERKGIILQYWYNDNKFMLVDCSSISCKIPKANEVRPILQQDVIEMKDYSVPYTKMVGAYMLYDKPQIEKEDKEELYYCFLDMREEMRNAYQNNI